MSSSVERYWVIFKFGGLEDGRNRTWLISGHYSGSLLEETALQYVIHYLLFGYNKQRIINLHFQQVRIIQVLHFV